MRAAIFRGPMDIGPETVDEPLPSPDGIVIKVSACCICGSDLHMYKLGLFTDFICRDVGGRLIPGHEYSGRVSAIGDNVSDLAVGDRVVAYNSGGMADYVPVSPALVGQNVYRIPDSIDDDSAATLEPLANSVHAVRKGVPADGDCAVVFGAGIIGLGVVQVLRAMDVDLHKIIAVDVSDKRLAMARQVGADDTVNVANEDLVDRMIQITGSVDFPMSPGVRMPQVDIAYDCVGYIQDRPEAPVLQQAMNIVRPDSGRIVAHGVFEAPVMMDFSGLVGKQIQVTGSFGTTSEETQQAIDWMAGGDIDRSVLVSHHFPLEEIAAAYDTQATVADSIKVLVNP